MKLNRTVLFLIFLGSIFMGIVVISIGLGAVFPSLNRIAKPFICPRGEMELETQTYRPYPGETVTTLQWYCADQETGERTELGLLPMALVSGVIYGLLLFVVIALGLYLYPSLYERWELGAYFKTAEGQKRAEWIRYGLIAAFVVGMIWIAVVPFPTPTSTTSSSTPTPILDTAATSIALTFQSLHSGTPVPFTSTEKPLANWNNIPVMSQATAGQAVSDTQYTFNVPADSGTITNFYHTELGSLGWDLKADRFLGMEFTKDQNTLLIALSPASDLQSWVVTLVLVR